MLTSGPMSVKQTANFVLNACGMLSFQQGASAASEPLPTHLQEAASDSSDHAVSTAPPANITHDGSVSGTYACPCIVLFL